MVTVFWQCEQRSEMGQASLLRAIGRSAPHSGHRLIPPATTLCWLKRKWATNGPAINRLGTRKKWAMGMTTETMAASQRAASALSARAVRAGLSQDWIRTSPVERLLPTEVTTTL